MAWTYSDYVTLSPGATRLARFRLHIQEVSDALSAETSRRGRAFATASFQAYLDSLKKSERDETRRCNIASGNAVGWTRARPRSTP